MYVREIQAMGWTVTRTGYGLLLEKQGVSHVARTWPLDLKGRVNERTVNSLAADRSAAPATRAVSHQAGITVVGSGKPGHLW